MLKFDILKCLVSVVNGSGFKCGCFHLLGWQKYLDWSFAKEQASNVIMFQGIKIKRQAGADPGQAQSSLS